MARKSVVIIGAGPSGLSVAWGLKDRRDIELTLLEKTAFTGGLSRTLKQNGLTFDIGPHRLSPQLSEIVDSIRGMLSGRLDCKKNLHGVYFGGTLYNYPPEAKDFLNWHSLKYTASFGFSWLKARLADQMRRARGKTYSFEENLLRYFGARFCAEVAFPMIYKVWGSRDLHPEFAKIRFALPTVGAMVKRVLGGAACNDAVFYYPHEGFGRIWDTMAANIMSSGGKLETAAAISTIEMDSLSGPFEVDYAQGAVRKKVRADVLVSTVSNNDFIDYTRRARCMAELKVKPGVFKSRNLRLGVIGVEEFALPTRVIIFPERKYVFNRIAEMNQFSALDNPDGLSILLVDVICDCGDAIDALSDDAFNAMLKKDLLSLGWFGGGQIKIFFSRAFPAAYPLLDNSRYGAQEELEAFLKNSAIILCGREASSDYNNAHNAVSKGFLTAKFIAGDITGPEYAAKSRLIGRLPIQD